MEELETLLKTPLDTENPDKLLSQLAEVEAWQYIVSTKHREAKRTLDEMRKKLLLHDRDENGNKLTEYTRKIRLDGLVAQYREEADGLEDISEIIKRRISLGQTLSKSMQTEMRSGLR